MSPGRPNPILRVMFDENRFADDLAHSDPTGRQIAQAARAQLERDGIQARLLAHCDPEGRDGTNLQGMVKVYLPIPYGDRFGLVLEPGRDANGLYLLAVAFGQRHPARRPSVYDIAHHRRHGQWPGATRQPRLRPAPLIRGRGA